MSASFQVSMKLEGLGAAVLKTGRLSKKIKNDALRKGMRAAGAVFSKELKKAAPRDTGLLKRGMTHKVKTYRKAIVAISGARRRKDPKTGRNAANYLHLVEDGTKPHTIPGVTLRDKSGRVLFSGTVQHPGARARRFVETVHRQNRAAATKALSAKVAEAVLSGAK